ncbi:hypothetical protein GYMLUDRAFT_246997 [Collybiopsis luxurians FD-317 M1]|uniref:Uncharacterized protein n=1 Tax=Collybiopsis luxurians FD-317 M1 TaxID=944289 RepID=A0A0D0C4J3_9AGAR|nr:hypothetical protein GYMLUDRAFT_246997 [Collybiopsis luxurians FD-317 M1]
MLELKRNRSGEVQVGIPPSLIDELELEYVPPDHEVFQLTPLAFNQAANIVYNQLHRPKVTFRSFWAVYRSLLAGIEAIATGEFDAAVSAHAETVHRMNSNDNDINRMDLLPNQRPRILNDATVGFHQIVMDDRSVKESDIIYAAFSDDEPDDEEF